MRRFILSFVGLMFCALSATAAEDVPSEGYLIQPGDTLFILVWKEEGLASEVIVRPDGRTSFPLVGSLEAAGRTVEAFEQAVTERLARFIPEPVVTATVRQVTGNIIYVIGQVLRPGAFPMSRNVDVVQALALAGGLNPYAAPKKIQILRREQGELRATGFNYADIEVAKNLAQNIVLQAGDTVVVP